MTLIGIAANIRFWIAAGLLAGLAAGDMGDAGAAAVMVALIAMMSISLIGLEIDAKDIAERRYDLALGLICCYVAACAVTLAVGSFFDRALWNGWVLVASVPCAVSVVSASLILKGDVKLALMSVTVVYLAGIGITPLLTNLLIGDAVSPVEILKYVLLFILVPILLSVPVRKATVSPAARNTMINVCFFVLIMITFGNNRDLIFGDPGLVAAVAAGCMVRIAAVHAAMEAILRRTGVERGTRIVLVLLSIWKNSALAMTLAMLLLPDAASALPAALSLPLETVWFMAMIWYYGRSAGDGGDMTPPRSRADTV